MLPFTDGDRHVLLTALAIAIEAINVAEEKAKPHSDQEDMWKLLEAACNSDAELEIYAHAARKVVHGVDTAGPIIGPRPSDKRED